MLKTLFLLALCPCGPGCDCGPGCACAAPQLVRQDVAQDPPADLPPPAWVLDRVQKMEARQAAVEFDLAALKADVRVVKQDAADAKRAAADTAAGIGRIEALLAEKKAAAAAPPPAPAAAPANRYLVNGHWYVDLPGRPGWIALEAPAAASGVAAPAPFPAGATTPGTGAPCAGCHSTSSPAAPAAGVTFTLAPGAGPSGCTNGGCAGGSCGTPQRAGLFFRRW